MSFGALILLAFAAVVLWFSVRWGCRLRCVGLEKAWLPQELQDARLLYVERIFRARSPVPIVARLDRGYRKVDGVIILVEFKTRRVNRLHLSDVIELSAQRLAVQAQTKEQVANYGYVAIQRVGSKRKTAHRILLLSTEAVAAIAKKREAILAKETVPQYASSEKLCDQCTFKLKCKQTANPWT